MQHQRETTSAIGPVWHRACARASALAALLVLAGVLRAWGHFPTRFYFVHGDLEPEMFLPALGLFSGDPFPRKILRAGSIYPLHLAYRCDYWIQTSAGKCDSREEYVAGYFVDPTRHLRVFWILSVLAGVGTVWATYGAAACVLRRQWSLLAAAVVALHPWIVYRGDLPEALPVLLSAVALWLLLKRRGGTSPTWREALSSFFLGLATAAKLYALPIIAAPLAHMWLRERGHSPVARRLGLGVLYVGLFALGFLVLAPFVLVHYPEAVRLAAANSAHLDVTNAKAPSRLLLHLAAGFARPIGFGPVGSLLAAVGAVVCLRRLRPPRVAVVLWPILVCLLLLCMRKYARHWLFPSVPAVSVLAAVGARWALRSWSATLPKLATPLATVLVLLILGPQAAQTALLLSQREGTSRAEAHAWVERHLPAGSSILLVGTRSQVPRLRPDAASLPRSGWMCCGRTACAQWLRKVQQQAASEIPTPPTYVLTRVPLEPGFGAPGAHPARPPREDASCFATNSRAANALATGARPCVALLSDESDAEVAQQIRAHGRLVARFKGAPLPAWARAIERIPTFLTGEFRESSDIEAWELASGTDPSRALQRP